jgi:hypothetical protein
MKIIDKILDKLDLKTILIICLILVILLMRSCSGGGDVDKNQTVKVNGKNYVLIKREVDTIYKEITQTVYRDGKTIYRDIPIYVNVPSDVDTNEILKDYYAKYTFKDTLKLTDSLGYIAITDTIFKNRILNRVWDSHVNKITIKETLYLKDPPKIQVFAGGVIGFDKVNIINFVGPSLLLKDKKDRMYSLGIGYSNAKTVSIQGGMYWKISLKKDK